MMDSADPLSGWEIADVLGTNIGNATNDLYGKLYAHVWETLLSFQHRLCSTGVNFELHCLDAKDLPNTLALESFARIEVMSSITLTCSLTKHLCRRQTSAMGFTSDPLKQSLCWVRSCKSRVKTVIQLY